MQRSAAVLALAFAVVACGPALSPVPSGGPSASQTPTAPPGYLEHPTGADEAVLRLETGGGFVAPGFFVTQGPIFSLFGDGTVIFRDASDLAPPPIGSVVPSVPYRIHRLTEEQVQALLRFAVGPGALGGARASYDPGNVADVGTTTFTLAAGGIVKRVGVVGLGMDNWSSSPDAPTVTALAMLSQRLATFRHEAVSAPVWSPDRFRGILRESSAGHPISWPWNDISPADFRPPAEPGRPSFPIRTMTAAEVAVLGLTGIEGGLQGLDLKAPDGRLYDLALRPLLPDEKS